MVHNLLCIFILNEKVSSNIQETDDLRSQIVTSSSSNEVSSSSSRSTQTEILHATNRKPLTHVSDSPGTNRKPSPPVPGNLQNYLTLLDFATNKPYKCLKCHKQLLNLKMCVVHLHNVHAVSLKQSQIKPSEISSAEMQSSRTDPLEQTESPRPDPPIQMELPRPCFPKQTARKSIPRPREPKVKKVTRKQATLKTIRRKCIKQMERRRIATIKVALIRQQFGATRHQYDATPDNNFPIYSACSTPDSLSVSPAGIDRLLASPDAADQSQPSTSQSCDLSNQSTLTISNNSKSRSKSDDCDSQLNTVPANVSNLSHHPFKDSPVTTQSYSEVAVSKVVSTRAEEKGRPQESLWSSLEFNSAKERAQAKLTPSKSVPLKKRKFSLDNHQTATLVGKLPHQFSPAQMQSTAMLKQLKPRARPQNPTSSSCSSTQHKVLFHSKSVPGTASIEQERPKLKQTARKTTKPCRASPYLSTTGSPRAVEEYLNSSENKKFLIESKREPGSTHCSPPLKRNLSFKSISKKSSPLHFPIAASSNTNSSTKTIEPNVATSASSLQTFLASDPSPEEREKNLKKSSGRKSISKPYSRLTGEKPRSLNLD